MMAQLSPNSQSTPPTFLVNSGLKKAPKNGLKSVSGFVPSVLSHHRTPKALFPMACRGSRHHIEKRFFLLSIKESKPSKQTKPKKSQNRKYATKQSTFIHNGKPYLINATKSGIYTPIMHKIIEQLEICLNKWKRVLVVRFDLHTAFYSGDNKRVSKFRKNLLRRIQRKYGMFEVGYVWAREVEKAKAQHYHFALFLDGNKVRHSQKILEMVSSTWKAVQHKNHVPVIPKPYHFIDSRDSKEDAIYRISYLAKTRGKGYRDPQTKDFNSSRLTKPVKLKT